jgi:hypothetical protein
MAIKLFLNGEEIANTAEYEKMREALHGIMTTKNVDSKTVKAALENLGADFADGLAAQGESTDVISVVESEVESPTNAEYVRENLINRIRVALTVATWSGKIVTAATGKAPTAKVEQKKLAF